MHDPPQHPGHHPTRTLIDLASYIPPSQLEAAVSAADKRGLTDPEALRAALDDFEPRRPGVARFARRSTGARSGSPTPTWSAASW
jgi:hypothetical protein